ncbi:MAG: hypothetical protein U0Z53_26845 [Blastocatellia bacterium]
MKNKTLITRAALGIVLLMTATVYAQSEMTENAVGVQEGICSGICFRSPQYYRLNLAQSGDSILYRKASVVIGGVNFNQPISVGENIEMIRDVLQGGSFASLPPAAPLARLNQEFLAAQLSLALVGGTGSSRGISVFRGQLQCYRSLISFRPVILSNGVTLTPFSTLGELFEQALSAVRGSQTADMDALAGLLNLLNGNDVSGHCFATAPPPIQVPRDYPTIQEAVNAARPGDVIRVGRGEFKGASVNKPVTIIGEGAETRITSGVSVPVQLPDRGFPPFAFVGFLISFGGSGATISNFRIELTNAPVIPNPIMIIGVHVRHADDVTVIHNEIVGPGVVTGPGAAAFAQYSGIYLLGANRCTVALNKVDGTYNGIGLRSDPFINTPTTNNEVVHNRLSRMRIGIGLEEHRMNPATGFGPEQPVQQNNFLGNSVQGEIGLSLSDLAGTLRDFIRDNNFTRNDFTQCATPLQENVPGMANKNHFLMNPGLQP